jgi:cysteine desulfuration protein SufE
MEARSAIGHGKKDGTRETERDTSMDKEEVIKILEDNKITNVTPPSTIQSKLEAYIDILNEMEDMLDRYTWLMEFGKKSAIVPERFKLKEFEVPSCQSQTWLVPHFTYEDTIYFTADSAALISKGMVCMLADVFSNSTRSDIASFEEKSLDGLNLNNLLTPGRRNGVYSMLKVIQSYGSRKD